MKTIKFLCSKEGIAIITTVAVIGAVGYVGTKIAGYFSKRRIEKAVLDKVEKKKIEENLKNEKDASAVGKAIREKNQILKDREIRKRLTPKQKTTRALDAIDVGTRR